MHGIGNDYIYVDCTENDLPNPSDLSKKLSDRRKGIGSDGLIMICRGKKEEFRMRMFNADGSEGKMCGNGIRCVAKFIYDKGLSSKTLLNIETLSGVKYLKLHVNNNTHQIDNVIVDMGKADFEAKNIPVNYNHLDKIINQRFVLNENEEEKEYYISCVSMGNPHCVIFADKNNIENIFEVKLEKVGALFEKNEIFPEQVNTEFVEVISRDSLRMRVWERGSGETMACGTGACAVVAAAVLNGYCDYDTPIKVILLGGELSIIYKNNGAVLMEGSAETVFEGTIEI